MICSDSQAAMDELDRYLVRSREVLRCKGLLGKLASAISVSLLSVPGHSGVIGNEKVDRLANTRAGAIRATRCSVGLRAAYLEEMLENGSVNGAKEMPGREGFEAGEVAHRRTAKLNLIGGA